MIEESDFRENFDKDYDIPKYKNKEDGGGCEIRVGWDDYLGIYLLWLIVISILNRCLKLFIITVKQMLYLITQYCTYCVNHALTCL